MTQVRREVVNVMGFTLIKDLHENERICQTCQGLGLVVRDLPCACGEQRTDGAFFPHLKQYVTFCPDCYVGVQTLCPYCKEPKPKYTGQCNCEGARAERQAQWEAKQQDRVRKAQHITLQEAVAAGVEMFYSDGLDRFLSLDDLYDLDEEEQKRLGTLWATTPTRIKFDAESLIEKACQDLHEEAYEHISPEAIAELQKLLDDWAERHGSGTLTYLVDYSRVIIDPESGFGPSPDTAETQKARV